MKSASLLSLMNEKYKSNSSEKNYALILCGNVLADGVRIRLPGQKIDINAEISIEEKKFVSRGGLKLEHAIGFWNIGIEGKGFLDAGSSTGGFTDCLLQHGALFVHSVDVGYNQIDYNLRNNKNVILHEKTNIMHIESLDPVPDIGVADLSFRSINRAASKILSLVSERRLIALVKPQFETGSENLKKGIVQSKTVLEETLLKVIDSLFDENAFVLDIIKSPVSGRKGNNEFLFYITGDSPVNTAGLKNDLKIMLKTLVYG